jgi:uncharacterized protein
VTGGHPVTFACAGHTLVGVLHRPAAPARVGVVVVVGGPQYRAGSHRQYVLLARALAGAGIAVLRFDQRGVGDSDGEFAGFEHLSDDIAAATAALRRQVPGLDRIVLWGLCDAATAILFHLAAGGADCAGAILLNPWVRTEAGLAAARVRGYYGRRLWSPAFWAKLLRGGVDLGAALGESAHSLRSLLRRRPPPASLPQRVADAMAGCPVPLLLILCGDDLTALEFERTVLRGHAGAAELRRLGHANHTYSRADWRAQVHAWTLDWLTARNHEVGHAMADKAD